MGNVIWDGFEERKKKLFNFTNGKKVVLWGYGYSGWFIEHLFLRENRQIEYIVDDGDLSRKLKLYNSFILRDLDCDTHAVILSFSHDNKAEKFLKETGYKKNIHYVYARELFYGDDKNKVLSYYDWLEHLFGIDIKRGVPLSEMESVKPDSIMYSVGVDYSIAQILDNFVFTEKDAVFDFGCGKGGALCLFQKYGMKKFGGVEYDANLYSVVKANLKKLGFDATYIIHGDAAEVKDILDSFNYFYMYNPFVGDTFRKVVRNMEESYERCPRRITLIYQGAHLHRDVVANGKFKLAKEVYTDTWCRYVNIYTITP